MRCRSQNACSGKATSGCLLCFGGAGFARALLQGNLVDELQLFVNPGVAGAGTQIFDATQARTRFRAIDAAAYTCGIVVTGSRSAHQRRRLGERVRPRRR